MNESSLIDAISSFIPGLRRYQTDGIAWLYNLYQENKNGILADEMGLGKTVQILGLLLYLSKQSPSFYGPHLIVTPLTVMNSWISEIEKFFDDDYEIYIHYGDKEDREEELRKVAKAVRGEQKMYEEISSRDNSRKSIQYRKSSFSSNSKRKRRIFLMFFTYEMIIKDINLLTSFSSYIDGFQYLIVDEAHRIKNAECVLYNSLLRLRSSFILLLTGTPLQNSVKELLSLLYFITANKNDNENVVDASVVDRLLQFEDNLLKGNFFSVLSFSLLLFLYS
jgi:SNF2 family DNA or RNA helicase